MTCDVNAIDTLTIPRATHQPAKILFNLIKKLS